MKRKMIVSLVSAILGIGILGLSTGTVSAAQFSDTDGHWASYYIDKAADLRIINGYTDGTFRPDESVTRSEFAGMTNRTFGNSATAPISFPDVYYGAWYYSDVAKAVSATYVAGYADGYFRPEDPISRQEAAVMLARLVPSGGNPNNLRNYPDSASVAPWAFESFSKVGDKGYMGPYKNDNRLHPTDPLTRAQTAKILCDIKEREVIITSDPIVKSNNTTLSNRIYSNNLTIHKDLENSSATIDDCVILGTLNIEGGGDNSININDTRAANCKVRKSASAVRVKAKGTTTIANLDASYTSIIETSGLSGGDNGKGFSKINIGSSADVTMRGSFPKVLIDGSNANLLLDSGTISELNVTSSGKGAKITVPRGSTVTDAEVNAASSFRGTGSINSMRVNANNVTYETKPRNLTVASGIKSPNTDDSYTEGATFNPSYKATKVGLSSNITITFDSPMRLYNEKTIYDYDISDFVTLRKNSGSGSSLSFSGTISNSKRVITIDPRYDFDKDTRYYVTVDKNAMKDQDGYGNPYLSSYFDTGESATSSSAPFSPANAETNVALDKVITVSFPDEVVRYSNGADISRNDPYLIDCIDFRADGATGEKIPFSATINSDKTTISLTPDQPLTPARKYYVGVLGNRLKSISTGQVVTAKNVSWSTIGPPQLSNFNAETEDTSIKATAKGNVYGTYYVIAVPGSSGAKTPSPAQIAAGLDGNGFSVASGYKVLSSGASGTVALTGLSSETGYVVYAVLKDGSGNYSSPVTKSTVTTDKFRLSSIKLTPVNNNDPNNDKTVFGLDFIYSTNVYDVWVPYGTTAVNVAINPGTNIFLGSAKVNGSPATINNPNTNTVGFLPGAKKTTVQIEIKEENKSLQTYTLNISVMGSSKLTDISGSDSLSNKISMSFTGTTVAASCEATPGAATLTVTPEDPTAKVYVDGSETPLSHPLSFNPTISYPDGINSVDMKIKVVSGDGHSLSNYVITFKKPKGA